jgi:hypothetical protein
MQSAELRQLAKAVTWQLPATQACPAEQSLSSTQSPELPWQASALMKAAVANAKTFNRSGELRIIVRAVEAGGGGRSRKSKLCARVGMVQVIEFRCNAQAATDQVLNADLTCDSWPI